MQNTLEFKTFTADKYTELINFYNGLFPDEPIGLEPLQDFDTKRSVNRVLIYQKQNLTAYYDYRLNDNSKENGQTIKIICKNDISKPRLESIYIHLGNSIKVSSPKHLITRILETEKTLHSFFLSNGFKEEERMWPSTLILDNFESKTLEGSLEKAQSLGIRFKTLTEFENNESTQLMYYNCVRQCLQDVPTAEEINIWPFETWKERYWESKERLAEGSFMAFDRDKLVGISQLVISAKEGNLKTGLTGVLRDYRAKGIAKALKLLATKYAIAKGYKTISTYNHSINKPMLAINEAMGYEKSPAVIFLKKHLH